MCRERRLYDVERWIAEGKPLQLAPDAILKGTRPKTALQIALEGGQHSLAFLLSSGYRLELERYAPLDMALGYHVRAGNEKGINLCLWAGADAHAPAPNPELGLSEDADPEDEEERSV
jgi:hypothetical protein